MVDLTAGPCTGSWGVLRIAHISLSSSFTSSGIKRTHVKPHKVRGLLWLPVFRTVRDGCRFLLTINNARVLLLCTRVGVMHVNVLYILPGDPLAFSVSLFAGQER